MPPPVSFYDTYTGTSAQGPLGEPRREAPCRARRRTWTNFIEHPSYDAFWTEPRAAPPGSRRSPVPTLVGRRLVGPGGLLRCRSPPTRRSSGSTGTTGTTSSWGRGITAAGPGATGRRWATSISAAPRGSTSARRSRRRGSPTGSRARASSTLPRPRCSRAASKRWRSLRQLAAEGRRAPRKLYFRAGGQLSFDPPTPREAQGSMYDSYVSDPAHPIPYRKRPIELTYDPRGSHWRPWLYEDQRFVDGRPDILVWRTEPLTEDLTIGGDIAAHLFASTTGSDADWVVKLIDVFPDTITQGPVLGGYEFMVSQRDHARPLPAGLRPRASRSRRTRSTSSSSTCTSRATPSRRGTGSWCRCRAPGSRPTTGIRRRSSRTSSSAAPGDFRAATHRVYRNGRYPSYVDLPVLGGAH